jgi:hypothetical protein
MRLRLPPLLPPLWPLPLLLLPPSLPLPLLLLLLCLWLC